jgi:hypothetical protein
MVCRPGCTTCTYRLACTVFIHICRWFADHAVGRLLAQGDLHARSTMRPELYDQSGKKTNFSSKYLTRTVLLPVLDEKLTRNVVVVHRSLIISGKDDI